MEGKTKLYGGMGPVRYQKTVNIGSRGEQPANGGGLLALVKRIFGGW
jgi:hypothetical protein